jgi:hypothetical protein
MKGRDPIRRGSQQFSFHAEDFNNPLIRPHFRQSTSGSTGTSTEVGISLLHFREQLIHTALSAHFHGVENASVALWIPVSEWSVSRAMRLSKVVGSVRRWFTQLPFRKDSVSFQRAASTACLGAYLSLRGTSIAFPAYAPMSDPSMVVDWLGTELANGRKPFLITYTSAGTRACSFATGRSQSLEGATLLIGGESVTEARRQVVEESGARCLPLFGCTETGESAEGCLRPSVADDMHVYEHKFALVSRKKDIGFGEHVDTPLFTTLSPHTPKIFLNGDTGDAAIVEQRDCGCPWGELGLRTHLRDVWSYSKFTAEGMTLPGELILEALERVLPGRFGGKAGDYQLIAEPNGNGVTSYLLAVNPTLGPIDEAVVESTFLEAISAGTYREMADLLHRSGQLRLVRREPSLQSGGKSLPAILHGSGKQR